MSAPTIKLNNGCKIPILGLGTWQSEPGIVAQVVKEAIKCGYRHIDCAFVYGNEAEIGTAIKEVISEGIVKRDELFITSKLWNTFHKPELVVPACKNSLKKLNLDYLDLYLVHWPMGFMEDKESLFPVDENGVVVASDVDYVETWKAMEKCVQLGLSKSIGISNFNSEQIDRLLSVATIKPVVNQIEVHPLLNQKKLTAFCKQRGIEVIAYSPFGSPARPWAEPGDPTLDLNDKKLEKIGEKYNKTSTQVILRYLVDIGVIPIPKSSNKDRLKMNIGIFNFKLTDEEIKVIDTFNCNGRICPWRGTEIHKYYPFHIEY